MSRSYSRGRIPHGRSCSVVPDRRGSRSQAGKAMPDARLGRARSCCIAPGRSGVDDSPARRNPSGSTRPRPPSGPLSAVRVLPNLAVVDQAAPLRGAVPGPVRAGLRPWGPTRPGGPGSTRIAATGPGHSLSSQCRYGHARAATTTTRAELGGDAEARGGHGIPAGYRDPGTPHRFRPKPHTALPPQVGAFTRHREYRPSTSGVKAGRSFGPAPSHGPNPTGCPLARAEPLACPKRLPVAAR